MSVFLVYLLSCYHLYNIISDIRFRVTQVFWHFLFLVLGFVLYYMQSGGWKPIIVGAITLLVGNVLERTKLTYPGDTKMLIVTSVWLCILLPNVPIYHIVLGIHVFYFGLFFAISYAALIVKRGMKGVEIEFRNFKIVVSRLLKDLPLPLFILSIVSRYQNEDLHREMVIEKFPGAINVALANVFYFLLATYFKEGFF